MENMKCSNVHVKLFNFNNIQTIRAIFTSSNFNDEISEDLAMKAGVTIFFKEYC